MDFFSKLIDIFTNFTWYIDGVEILLLAVVIYILFCFLRYNNTAKVAYLFMALFVLAFLFTLFEFSALKYIVLGIIAFSWVFIIVIYSVSIKRLFWNIEKTKLDRINRDYSCTDEELIEATDNIVKALLSMAKKDFGALIVMSPNELPATIIQSGTILDAVVSSELVESLFNHNSPLHDGAVFIKANKIVAAGCFLPLTQEANIPKELGTRHRAAIGISESAEFVALVVSEETGIISIAQKGELKRYADTKMLTDKIYEIYGIKNPNTKKTKQWSWWKR